MVRDRIVDQVGDLRQIQNSPAFDRFLEKRKKHLQKQINAFIEAKEWYEAYGALMKFKDIDKLKELLGVEVERLTKQEE